jgi:hypothetical protein
MIAITIGQLHQQWFPKPARHHHLQQTSTTTTTTTTTTRTAEATAAAVAVGAIRCFDMHLLQQA